MERGVCSPSPSLLWFPRITLPAALPAAAASPAESHQPVTPGWRTSPPVSTSRSPAQSHASPGNKSDTMIMRRIPGGHLLCFLLLSLQLSWAEDTKTSLGETENLTLWSPAKTRRLFARQKIASPQQSHALKHKSNIMNPARRCGRLMESCSSHVPCCDPCASCRCRLFNTICHCWRINPLCLRRT